MFRLILLGPPLLRPGFAFQFPYGNYFCLDTDDADADDADIFHFMFQFPYGNYFCLDSIQEFPEKCEAISVSIPLRELFLFRPRSPGVLETQGFRVRFARTSEKEAMIFHIVVIFYSSDQVPETFSTFTLRYSCRFSCSFVQKIYFARTPGGFCTPKVLDV